MMTKKKKNKNRELFAKKRKRLKAEMDIAEKMLKKNIDGLNIFDYVLPATSQLLPSVGESIKNQPANLLVPIDLVTRQFLSEKHWIRKIVKLLNSFGFLLK